MLGGDGLFKKGRKGKGRKRKERKRDFCCSCVVIFVSDEFFGMGVYVSS